MLAVNLLIGKKDARTDRINQTVLPNVPEFAIVDLLSSYTDYLLGMYEPYVFMRNQCVNKFSSFNCGDLLALWLSVWEASRERKGPRTETQLTARVHAAQGPAALGCGALGKRGFCLIVLLLTKSSGIFRGCSLMGPSGFL